MAPINVKTAGNDFLAFVNASPTPFHAVKSVKERLTKAGFKEIKVKTMQNPSIHPLIRDVGKRSMDVKLRTWR